MSRSPHIPLELFFGNAERQSAQISPNGEWLGWSEPVEGVMNIFVGPVANPLEEGKAMTADSERGIQAWFWAEDNRHIVYMQDKGGDENWRLYGVDVESGEVRDYTPYDAIQAQVVKISSRHPDAILISMNLEDQELHDIYLLNLETGNLTLQTKNLGGVVGWVADEDLQILAALLSTEQGGYRLMLRPSADAEWQEVREWNREDAGTSTPIGFNADGSKLYMVDSKGANAARAVAMDVNDHSIEVLYEDPRYDVTALLLDKKRKTPMMVCILRDRTEWAPLDDRVGDDLQALEEYSGEAADWVPVGRTADDAVWTIAFDHSDGSTQYHLYHRADRSLHTIFSVRPELDKHDLAPMECFAYTARDGREMHGYITFPLGVDRKNLPMVLNVHGGPWTRDTWGYHPEAQWLANRGYICMQVNYRGSTGYGKDHMNAGDREWGGKMHDDLVDAVAWAVEEGYADRDRVAIYGGSYGGYSALVGATFTPEVFCCSVALVGPSNLITFINSIPPYWRPLLGLLKNRVGNPDTEPDFLLSRSPISRVDDIAIPMLVAHGANDPRVKQEESEQIVAAMKEKGIKHEYLLFEDEGHGFVRPENKLRFYGAVDQFLAEHMAVTVEG